MVFAFAVGGAFATNTTTKLNLAPIEGYLSVDRPCDTPVTCQDSGIPGCTVPGGTAYGKINPSDNHCPIPLFRP